MQHDGNQPLLPPEKQSPEAESRSLKAEAVKPLNAGQLKPLVIGVAIMLWVFGLADIAGWLMIPPRRAFLVTEDITVNPPLVLSEKEQASDEEPNSYMARTFGFLIQFHTGQAPSWGEKRRLGLGVPSNLRAAVTRPDAVGLVERISVIVALLLGSSWMLHRLFRRLSPTTAGFEVIRRSQ